MNVEIGLRLRNSFFLFWDYINGIFDALCGWTNFHIYSCLNFRDIENTRNYDNLQGIMDVSHLVLTAG
jgi:hypothetical protein